MCCWPAFKYHIQQQQESRQTQMGLIKGKEWITSKEHTNAHTQSHTDCARGTFTY